MCIAVCCFLSFYLIHFWCFYFLFACQIFNMHFIKIKKRSRLKLASADQEVAILKYTQRPSENPNINYNFRWRPQDTTYPSGSHRRQWHKKESRQHLREVRSIIRLFSVARLYPCCCSFWPPAHNLHGADKLSSSQWKKRDKQQQNNLLYSFFAQF